MFFNYTLLSQDMQESVTTIFIKMQIQVVGKVNEQKKMPLWPIILGCRYMQFLSERTQNVDPYCDLKAHTRVSVLGQSCAYGNQAACASQLNVCLAVSRESMWLCHKYKKGGEK